MKRKPEQAGIIPALALIVDVEHELLLRRAGSVLKRPDAALAFPDAKLVRARHKRQADGIGEEQVREGVDRRPVARNGRGDFRHGAVEKRADGRARIKAVGFSPGLHAGKDEAADQRKHQGQFALRREFQKRAVHKWIVRVKVTRHKLKWKRPRHFLPCRHLLIFIRRAKLTVNGLRCPRIFVPAPRFLNRRTAFSCRKPGISCWQSSSACKKYPFACRNPAKSCKKSMSACKKT